MKKLIALTALLCLFLAAGAASAGASVTLVYAEEQALDSVAGAMASAFREKLESLSGSSVQVVIRADGVLGTGEQVLDNMIGGGSVADLTCVPVRTLAGYGCEKAGLLTIPYAFTNEDHFWTFAESELAKEFLDEPRELSLRLRGLCYGEEGLRHFFFSREVKRPNDVKGLRICVPNDPVIASIVSDMQASTVEIPYSGIYTALYRGEADGSEQTAAYYRDNGLQAFAPYLLLDGHMLDVVELVISAAAWDRLSEEQQGWVTEAAKHASQVCREKITELGTETSRLLEQDGVNIISVEDRTVWVEACQSTINTASGNNTALYRQLTALAG